MSTSLQFAATTVVLLQLYAPKMMGKHSCESEGSFYKDVGLMTYSLSFFLHFFLIQMMTSCFYNDKGLPTSKTLSFLSASNMIKFEAYSTDIINTISSIYFLNLFNLPSKTQEQIKISLYVLTLLSPSIDAALGLASNKKFSKLLIALLTNHNALNQFMETHGYKLAKHFKTGAHACFDALNLSSTIIMITSYMINLFYDSTHTEDYPNKNIVIGVSSAIAVFLGGSISLSNNDSLQTILSKCQSAADSFYYVSSNSMAITSCANPNAIINPAGFKSEGYKFAIGISAMSAIIAITDYFKHQPPKNYAQVRRVSLFYCQQENCLPLAIPITKFCNTFLTSTVSGYLPEEAHSPAETEDLLNKKINPISIN